MLSCRYSGLCITAEDLESTTTPTSGSCGDNITDIGQRVFGSCINLTDIYIGNSIKNISLGVFGECTSIENVYITNMSSWCNIKFNEVYSNPLYYADNFYFNGQLITDLVIPDDITIINNHAFSGYISLNSVSLNNVTHVVFLCI